MGRSGTHAVEECLNEAAAASAIEEARRANAAAVATVNTYYDCGHGGYARFVVKRLPGVAASRALAETECARASHAIDPYGDNYMHLVTMAYRHCAVASDTPAQAKRKRDAVDAVDAAVATLATTRAARPPLTRGATLTCVRCASTIRVTERSVGLVRRGMCPACADERDDTINTALGRRYAFCSEYETRRQTLAGREDNERFERLAAAVAAATRALEPVLVETQETRVLLVTDTCTGHS